MAAGWRAPSSLEYLDALLSGGTARYADVTARLDGAVTARLSGTDRSQWLLARTGLDAALAETVALAADDILLDDLLGRLAGVSGAADLLLGVSVYREPVDRNAVLFQTGQPDTEAENIPDRVAAYRHIASGLAAAGITPDASFDLASVPGEVRAQLAPYIAELNRRPVPPFRPVPSLPEQITACQAASLLTVSAEGAEPRFFVHRWTATELAARLPQEPGSQLAGMHERAAGYWRWRVRVWPQYRPDHVHDLLEARHHLLQAGEVEGADQVTGRACGQLYTWGAWDQEASLIHDMLARLAEELSRRGAWIHQLGIVAQARGDYDEAARLYQRALDINEELGDSAGLAASYHQLGMLAQARGDYVEAARLYQRSLGINEELGDQAGLAAGYHQLGMLAQARGDDDEAARLYQRALDTRKRLGDQAGLAAGYHQLGLLAQARRDYGEAARQYQRALGTFHRLGAQVGMAASYHQLGMLAQARGDDDEAARLYQRALDIKERLGNQAGMATSYHQLGILARNRGDYEEAARQYQRALDIKERLGDRAGMATSYHQLGMLAQARGNYGEAVGLYQRALDIKERLGNQLGMATTYSQLGNLEDERSGSIDAAIAWHVKALVIRLGLGVPQARNNLRRLAAYRRERGAEPFARLLIRTADDADLAETITSLLDRLDEDGADTA